MAMQSLLLLMFPVLVVTAALRDVTSYTIPNWISAALILAFFPIALLNGVSLDMLGGHLAVGVTALAAGMLMFGLRWIGGGDAKLFAAAALWLGWPAVTPFVMITAVAGGALAVLLLGLRKSPLQSLFGAGPAWMGRLATHGESVPYGAAICVGALYAFPQSSLMQAFSAVL